MGSRALDSFEFLRQSSSTPATAMSAQTPLKDLPKVDSTLKGELEKFSSSNLKKTETEEKVHLPNAEDMAAEKQLQAHQQAIEGFNTSQLKHAETKEKVVLPAKEDIETERNHQNLFNGVTGFDKNSMRHAETHEKIALPGTEDIESEKNQQQLMSG